MMAVMTEARTTDVELKGHTSHWVEVEQEGHTSHWVVTQIEGKVESDVPMCRVKNNFSGQLATRPNTLKFGWPYSKFVWP